MNNRYSFKKVCYYFWHTTEQVYSSPEMHGLVWHRESFLLYYIFFCFCFPPFDAFSVTLIEFTPFSGGLQVSLASKWRYFTKKQRRWRRRECIAQKVCRVNGAFCRYEANWSRVATVESIYLAARIYVCLFKGSFVYFLLYVYSYVFEIHLEKSFLSEVNIWYIYLGFPFLYKC